jgi:hypothetical protein
LHAASRAALSGAINSERLGRKEKMENGNALHGQRSPHEVLPRRDEANSGVWNPITQAWMFVAAEDAANALCAPYQTTRPSLNQREALLEMAADGTGASAWDFDPAIDAGWIESLDREKASALLAAGYAVRNLLGRHPLEDVAEPVRDDAFDAS